MFTRFDAQDSGNVSYGVHNGTSRYFIKTAGDPDRLDLVLSWTERVAMLHNAVDLAQSVNHPVMPELHAVIESPAGPLLVYPWRDGDLLGRDTDAHQRFRALSAPEIVAALDTLYDLHAELDSAGWVEGDFYDGALMYDFERHQLTVMDLDTYRRGRYRNNLGRMFGSSRFMAPEEFTLGAPIDTRTTAYVMARSALVLLSDGTLDRDAFRGSDEQYAVVQEATTTRFPSFTDFHNAWRAAR